MMAADAVHERVGQARTSSSTPQIRLPRNPAPDDVEKGRVATLILLERRPHLFLVLLRPRNLFITLLIGSESPAIR